MSNKQLELETLQEVLGISGIAVTGWQYQGEYIIRIRVKSTHECGVCPECSQLCSQEHDVGNDQLMRDLPMSNRRCWLIYRPRRFECRSCERTFVERVSWKAPDLNYTLRYEEHIYGRCRRETVADVAQAERLSEDVVRNIFERWAKKTLPRVDIQS